MKPIISWSKEPEPGLSDLPVFVQELRKYSKKSIIEAVTAELWGLYKNHEWRHAHPEYSQIVNAYGPKIVMLGMATASTCRNKDLALADVQKTCQDYLGIRTTISDKPFLDKEAGEIVKQLDGVIDEKYLKFDVIRQSCTELFIVRGVREQHAAYNLSYYELLRAYQIFQVFDDLVSGRATEVCKKIYKINPVHFFRSGFMLFALGADKGKNGKITFGNLACEAELAEKLNIDPDTCQLVARHISYDESKLCEWYKKEVLTIIPMYQKYFPDPLYRHPLIHRDLGTPDTNFLIPAPALFIRGFINSFFSQIFSYDSSLKGPFGDAIEITIGQFLERVFGAQNVTKIKGNKDKEKADFYITLPRCDLIIEAKERFGSEQAQSVMAPENIRSIWARLYKASGQCAASASEFKKDGRPLVAVKLCADHATVEAMPFQTFSERSGLFSDLGLEGVECLSWNALEHGLSKTSVQKFEDTIMDKWVVKNRMSVADLLAFQMERDEPAHQYEYLNEVEKDLFGKNML